MSITLAALWLLAGCGLLGDPGSHYGTVYPQGEVIETACASVRSFDSYLRSSPSLRGPDSYVGYTDYGMGMRRSYLILPGSYEEGSSLEETLSAFSPRERRLWEEAVLISGAATLGQRFEARVPEKSRQPEPHSKIVERAEILIVGWIEQACDKHYLVAVMANPFGGESTQRDWDNARSKFDVFLNSIIWPDQ